MMTSRYYSLTEAIAFTGLSRTFIQQLANKKGLARGNRGKFLFPKSFMLKIREISLKTGNAQVKRRRNIVKAKALKDVQVDRIFKLSEEYDIRQRNKAITRAHKGLSKLGSSGTPISKLKATLNNDHTHTALDPCKKSIPVESNTYEKIKLESINEARGEVGLPPLNEANMDEALIFKNTRHRKSVDIMWIGILFMALFICAAVTLIALTVLNK